MGIIQTTPAQTEKQPIFTNGHDPDSKDGFAVSEELYWQKYYEDSDFNYEWNNGILEAKPMAKLSQSNMFGWFHRTIDQFKRVYRSIDFTMLEIGFELHLPTGKRVRKPDLGVVRKDNPTPVLLQDRTYHGVYDLCIESLSDSTPQEIKRDIDTKYKEYAQIGVREYYILDDQLNRHMGFYWRNQAGDYVEIQPSADGVICSHVLPGFQFRVSDLFRQPDLLEMSNDPVYQAFVWPEYQREKVRAEEEFQIRLAETTARYEAEERAKQEEIARQAEEVARQRAEERATAETVARQAEEMARQQAEERAKLEEVARQEAEKRATTAEAENARLLEELAKLRGGQK